MLTAARLRAHVVRRSLFAPTTLAAAVARLGFVQADPIRAPARAQDLILRHRVAGYRAGDLERAYPALGLDEDVLYAYGFVTPEVRRLLHPGAAEPPAGLAREVLAYARAAGPVRGVHPGEVAAHVGGGAERNAWGGQSRATTHALQHLHTLGLLRVARREQGVRIYAIAANDGLTHDLSPTERLREVTRWLAGLFAPLPEAALRRVLRYVPFIRREVPMAALHALVTELRRAGALEAAVVDGVTWVWPPNASPEAPVTVPRAVRFLAPFDPVVWDRARFEQLWGWAYRFEAYTPAAQRERGYYALPVLWGDRVVGWANVARRDGQLDVDLGFVGVRPRGAAFGRALDAEIARVDLFLRPRASMARIATGHAADVSSRFHAG